MIQQLERWFDPDRVWIVLVVYSMIFIALVIAVDLL